MLQRVLHAIKPLETKSAVLSPLWGLDAFVAPTTLSGTAVNAVSAMNSTAYAAALRLFSDALGTMPVKLMRRLADGGKEPATDHPLYDLIHDEANPWTSAGAARSGAITDAIQTGGGFLLVIRDRHGVPVELHRLDPGAVSVERDRNTLEPYFRVRLADGGEAIYLFNEVIHIPSPYKAADGISGLPFWRVAREALGLAIQLEASAAHIIANSATPSGVISSEKAIGDEGVSALGRSWRATFGSGGRGSVGVLDDGLKYESIPPVEMADQQFLEFRAFQVQEIARVFGVPVSMLGDLSRATWSNASEMNRQFLEHSLLPWIVTFEAAFTRALLTKEERKDYAVTFVTDHFTRANVSERATAYASFRASGVYTSNELRRLEGLPARADGDTLASPHVQSDNANAPAPKEDGDA